MEHAEALEQIETAAVEPDGLERLMAGDTPGSAAVAGHLAGCPDCAEELVRIRRTAIVARDVIRSEPDPALRDRTLAFVRSVGRDRSEGGAGASADRSTSITVLPSPVQPPLAAETPQGTRPSRRGFALLAIAAAVVIAVGVGFAAGSAAQRQDVEGRQSEIAVLEDATTTALRIQAQPDAQVVQLTATPSGGDATGSLAFSASTGELVAVATDLEPEEANEEYACWVEVEGQRQRLGQMYWAGDLWAWAGPVEGLEMLPEGAVFGVSLSPTDGGAGDPVLTGSL
ncbi:MAG TPA: anti-sigma factor [Candidatus Limnocylindrales bacterium]